MACGHARAHHQRGRRGQPQCTGASDHQHGHRVQRGRHPIPSQDPPGQAGDHCDDDHRRHEHGADLVHELLDGGLLRLRRLHQSHDARQLRLGPNRGGAHDDEALDIERPTRDRLSDFPCHGQALARDQGLVQVASAFDDDAVSGQALAGPHHQLAAHAHGRQRHLGLDAVPAHACGLRAKPPQGLQRRQCLALGTRLQPLAQHHQGDDHSGALEVQVGHLPRRTRRSLPPLRQAEAEGGGGADGHQQVHVPCTRLERRPAGLVEARAQPKLHGGCQQGLHPCGPHPVPAQQIAQHGHHQGNRQGSGEGDLPALVMGAAYWSGQHIGVGLHHARLVAGTLDRGQQQLGLGTRLGVDLSLLGGQVDAGGLHTGHLAQGLLHPRHAGGTGHAVDVQRVVRHAHTLSLGLLLQQTIALTRNIMTIEFTLPDMTCGHCVKTVTATVQQVDQAAQLKIDLPSHKVAIESDQPSQAFVAALTEEGYPPA